MEPFMCDLLMGAVRDIAWRATVHPRRFSF
jgi:hypothetical protein